MYTILLKSEIVLYVCIGLNSANFKNGATFLSTGDLVV